MTTRRKNGAASLKRGTGKSQFLYRQLANLIRADIDSSALMPGDLLPSMDELARQYKLNKATVRQAIVELTTEGLVYSVPAKGTFVAEKPKARSDNGARTLSIGWINSVQDEGNTGRYHTEMMDAVRSAVQELGGHLLVFSSSDTSSSQLIKSVGDAQLDGAILVGPAGLDPLRNLLSSSLPTVLIDDHFRGKAVDSILIDNEGGGYEAIKHLLDLGHEHIALVTGPGEWRVTQERLAGARMAMSDAGANPNAMYVLESNFSPEGGASAVKRLIRMRPTPTGVFFFNDEMAAGALQSLYATTTLKVPGDLSIVGFDDVQWSTLCHPPLTTIHVKKEVMGREAVARLKKIIEHEEHVPTTTIVPTQLIVRKSTAPVLK